MLAAGSTACKPSASDGPGAAALATEGKASCDDDKDAAYTGGSEDWVVWDACEYGEG
jgi:hypothetical protein